MTSNVSENKNSQTHVEIVNFSRSRNKKTALITTFILAALGSTFPSSVPSSLQSGKVLHKDA